MTRNELRAIQHHPGWEDGREGFLWPRFSAIVDETRFFSAEIAWSDDEKDPESDCFDPRLYLQMSTPTDQDGWLTEADYWIPIDDSTAIEILACPPDDLLMSYKDEWQEFLRQGEAQETSL